MKRLPGRTFLLFLFILLHSFSCAGAAANRAEHTRGLVYEPAEKLGGAPRFAPRAAAGNLPASVDYSSHIPPVGEQGMMPSCVSWAVGYYYKCFQENKDENWAREKGGWDKNELCSPAFLYNQVNSGAITDTYFIDNLNIITRMGIVSWNDMPYSNDPFKWHTIFGIDSHSLPTKQNYFDAARYRGDSYQVVFSEPPADADIKAIKSILAGGELVVFGMDTDGGDFDDFDSAGHCLDSQTYSGGGHAMTIVGYDDKFDGAKHGCPGAPTGAFHVVNSWGADWGDNGYFWITYKGAKNNMKSGYTMTDRKNYTPTVMAELDISHEHRGRLDVTFSAGADKMIFFGDTLVELSDGRYDNRSGLNVWVDLTDFDKAGRYPPDGSKNKWTVDVSNGDKTLTGTIEKFNIVKNGVSSGGKDTPLTVQPGASASAAIQPPAAVASTHLSIQKGWNLIGAAAEDAAIDPGIISGDGVEIYSFDGRYIAAGKNEQTNLATGEAYWIFSAKEFDMDVGGTTFRDTQFKRTLKSGWNVFSNPFPGPILWGTGNVSLSCGGAAETLPPVFSYEPDTGYVKIPADGTGSLTPGRGFIIKLHTACEMAFTD